jgi:thiol-disulfide isomerase/thioredoxin
LNSRWFQSLIWALCAQILIPCAAQAQWRDIRDNGLKQTPGIELPSIRQETIDLKKYQGKVVLLNFWASWCEPCRDEFDELIHLQQIYGPKGFQVIAVNLAESKQRVEAFLKNNQLNADSIEVLLDTNSQAKRLWRVRAIPTTYLIDRNGQARKYWVGELDTESDAFKQALESALNSRSIKN